MKSLRDGRRTILRVVIVFLIICQVISVSQISNLVGTGVANAASKYSFSDVHINSWSYRYIMKMAALGVTEGDGTGKFNPAKSVSHQEATIMALRFMGYDNTTEGTTELVLQVDDWASNGVQLAVQKGLLIQSEESGAADWGKRPATREWIARLIARVMDMQEEAAELAKDKVIYADASKVSPWAVGYVNVMSELQIINGFLDNTFKPQASITREQFTKILATAEALIEEMPGKVKRGTLVSLSSSALSVQTQDGEKKIFQINGDTIIYLEPGATTIEIGKIVTIVYQDSLALFVEKTEAKGDEGETGVTGPTGAIGPAGANGTDGAAGPAGPTGADGATGPAGAKGDPGAAGIQGAKGDPGPTGVQGPAGDKGDKGDPGPAGASSLAIIPFSSGKSINLTTVVGGLTGMSAALGFGSSTSEISTMGGVIDLTNANDGVTPFGHHAFSVPVNGTLTSISAFFSTTQAFSFLGSLTITAQLYSSTGSSNTFLPVPGAQVSLANPYTGAVAKGSVSEGTISGLAIPVTAGTRYLLVFSATATGLAVITMISGNAGAGIAIATNS